MLLLSFAQIMRAEDMTPCMCVKGGCYQHQNKYKMFSSLPPSKLSHSHDALAPFSGYPLLVNHSTFSS